MLDSGASLQILPGSWFEDKNYKEETNFQDVFEECWNVNALRLKLWDLNHYIE